MKVFLTGGTGLIGSHVAERLRDRGVPVVCLQRPTSDTAFLRGIGCRIVPGDVRDDPERTAASMEGCDRLVHAAALVYADAPWPRVRAVNVLGTERVLRAAASAGVARAVHLSSVAVYGGLDGPMDEDAPIDAPLHPTELYARSKRESERAARAIHSKHGLDVCVLRPSAVYGERDRTFAPALARILGWPVTPLLGSGDHTLPVVYAGNVAAAVTDGLEADRADGRVFNVAEDEPVTQRELLRGVARGMGVRPRFVSLPPRLVRWGARAGDSLGLRTPGAGELPLRRVASLALDDNPYPTERIRSDLAWRPPHRPGPALERTGRWLRRRKEADGADGSSGTGAGRGSSDGR